MIQLGLIDADSSACSLSVLLSAVETSVRTYSPRDSSVRVGGNYQYIRLCAACTSRGYYSRVVFILLRASDCVTTIRGWRLIEEIGIRMPNNATVVHS